MTKKQNLTFLVVVLFILISLDVSANEDVNKKSIFDNFSKFFKNLFVKEKTSPINPIENKDLKLFKSTKIKTNFTETKRISSKRLQFIVNSSNCLKKLPENSAIKFYIYDGDKKNEYFLSFGHTIIDYDKQKFDIIIGLNFRNLLNMENSTKVDKEIKKNINSKDLIFEYNNIFKALKYRNVLSCINEIKDEEKIEEVPQLLNIAREENLTNFTNETLAQNISLVINIFNISKLSSQRLKLFFENVQTYIPYKIVVQDTSDYNNLRSIKILTNWNSAFEAVDYKYINWSEYVSKENLILMGYFCSNNVTSLIINESDCEGLINDKKGIIKFYGYDSKSVLIIVGNNGQELVDTAFILTKHALFHFNDSDLILTNETMSRMSNAPQRFKDVISNLQAIYRKSEEYEELVSDRKLLWFAPYHPGKMFEDVQADLNGYKISEEAKEMLKQFNFGELAYKGNEVVKQQTLVRNQIVKLQHSMGSGVLNLKVDKNVINLETLKEYETKLEIAQKNLADLEGEYDKLIEMTEEIKVAWIKIQQLLGSNIVYSTSK